MGAVQTWAEMTEGWGSGLRRTTGPVPGFLAGSEADGPSDGVRLDRRVVGGTCYSSATVDAVGVVGWAGLMNSRPDQADMPPAPAK